MSGAADVDDGWDVIVIGAGPAGCAAAVLAATAGLRVMLVDRASFPRYKVCGCCLGAVSISALQRLGLDAGAYGRPLTAARITGWGRSVELRLAPGVVCSRESLDYALLQRAMAAGAHVRTRCHAAPGVDIGEARLVALRDSEGRTAASAALVLVTAGLGVVGKAGRLPPRHARVGLGAARQAAISETIGDEVVMALGADGYAGAVRLRDGRLNVAASIDRSLVETLGPGGAVDRVLTGAGCSPLGWRDGWRGTPWLGRLESPLGGRRLLAFGDAAGFAEPFTGEGIGWAIESVLRSRPAIVHLARRWSTIDARRWAREQRRWLRRAQLRSRLVAAVAGSRSMAPVMLSLAARWPWVLSPLAAEPLLTRASGR